MATEYIYGMHTVRVALQKKPQTVHKLLLLKGREDQKIKAIVQLANMHNIFIEYYERDELSEILNAAKHQGVAAEITIQKATGEAELEELLDSIEAPFVLILDGVQDPHNLGACLRTANAAGVHVVIAPKDRASSLTPIVRKVASGAAEDTPFFQVTNLARTMDMIKEKNIWIYGAAAEADKTIFDTDLTGGIALVLGAEGAGLRRLTQEKCDALVNIPMSGSVESLNVSVATGIILFEVVRQNSL